MKRFRWYEYLACALLTLCIAVLCVCLGSVSLPLSQVLGSLAKGISGFSVEASAATEKIVLAVRLPRTLCVALMGAALSLCGLAMQGLLRNPLADGSILGVSSGASLGAVLAIALGITFPGFSHAGTMGMAMLFAFGSIVLVIGLAYALDRSLASHTMILIGVVLTMFISSLIHLITVFAGEKVRAITFWTMGSLAGSSMENALTLSLTLIVCGGVLFHFAPELNALALGEEDAKSVGVSVGRVKLWVAIAVSAMTGVCVSIGGNIGFVGLMIPHAVRMIVGANHGRLMPASLFGGAIFLLLADLLARTVVSPVELPVGVVTSLIGAVAFLAIFRRYARGRKSL